MVMDEPQMLSAALTETMQDLDAGASCLPSSNTAVVWGFPSQLEDPAVCSTSEVADGN